jgi:Rab GDP dissociation inhibitor
MATVTMKEVYDKFGLETGTRDFIGHAMALYLDDSYLDAAGKAPEALERIRLYGNSVSRYGKSPYIYPLYGLGELPQGFARLSAIYGGTYMLNASVDEVLYENGAASGIKATMRGVEPEMKFETKAKFILADPSYFPSKAKVVGHVLRAICVLKHPIAGTNDADSCQLIIPQSQVGRKNDIYIACISSAHNVCPKGYYIAIVSTIAETSANHHLELQPGLERLGQIEEQFVVSFDCPSPSTHSPWLIHRRDPPSPCTSLLRMAPRTRSSSPRATMPPLTLRPPPMTCRISTAGAPVRSSRWMSCARVSRSLKTKKASYLSTFIDISVH